MCRLRRGELRRDGLGHASTPSSCQCSPTPLPDRLRAFPSCLDVLHALHHDRRRRHRPRHDLRGGWARCLRREPLMRLDAGARRALLLQQGADAEHPELRAADADARGPRCAGAVARCRRAPFAERAARWAAPEPMAFSGVRSSARLLVSPQRPASAAQPERERPALSLQPRSAFQLVLPARARRPRGDDAWMRLQQQRARASPRVQGQPQRFRGASGL